MVNEWLSLDSNYLIPPSALLTTTPYPFNIINRFICTFPECIYFQPVYLLDKMIHNQYFHSTPNAYDLLCSVMLRNRSKSNDIYSEASYGFIRHAMCKHVQNLD